MITKNPEAMAYHCRSIARIRGDKKSPVVWACNPDDYSNDVRIYEDAHVKITACGEGPALHVEMMLPHHNPVLCVAGDWNIYRTHGERTMLESHLRSLAILERPKTDSEIVEFIRYWGWWFYEHTETFNGALGRQLAYLWPMVTRGDQIAVTKNSSIVQVLVRNGIYHRDNPIYSYLDIESGR